MSKLFCYQIEEGRAKDFTQLFSDETSALDLAKKLCLEYNCRVRVRLDGREHGVILHPKVDSND